MDVYDSNGDYLGFIDEADTGSSGPSPNQRFNLSVMSRLGGAIFLSVLTGVLIYIAITQIVLKSVTVLDGLIACIPIAFAIALCVSVAVCLSKKAAFLLKCKLIAEEYKDASCSIESVSVKFGNRDLDSRVKALIPAAVSNDFIDMDVILDGINTAYKECRKTVNNLDIAEIILSATVGSIAALSIGFKCAGKVDETVANRLMAINGLMFGIIYIFYFVNCVLKVKKQNYPPKYLIRMIVTLFAGVIVGVILSPLFTAIKDEIEVSMECLALGVIVIHYSFLPLFKKMANNNS